MSGFIIRFLIIFLLVVVGSRLLTIGDEQHLKVYSLVIKNHYFEPEKLEIPANTKVVIKINNLDDTVEEFESFELKREKIIPANAEVKMTIGPLESGEYRFFGEFHEETAKGILKVN